MRDYDPTTGRYIQADPLGLVDGASVYGYARQSPGRYTDPRGENTLLDFFEGSGSMSRDLARCAGHCLDSRVPKALWKFNDALADRPHIVQCLKAFAKQYGQDNKARIAGRFAAGASYNTLTLQGLKRGTGWKPGKVAGFGTGLVNGTGLTLLAAQGNMAYHLHKGESLSLAEMMMLFETGDFSGKMPDVPCGCEEILDDFIVQ